jgi:DNA-binding transcriptional ArsR family regulator
MSNASTLVSEFVLPIDDARLIARFFQVLSDPTRVRMVKALADNEWCVSDLTEALGMDQPAVSHQLKYLRDHDILLSSIKHLECAVS